MEGQFFYLIGWLSWIIITFFFSDRKKRFQLSCVVLLLLSTSTVYASFLGFSWNGAFLILVVATFIYLVGTLKKRLMIHYFSISTVSLAYVCFSIFEIFDPVWVIFPRHWMLGFILLYICLIVFKKKNERYVYLLAGIIQGEIITIVLFRNIFSYSVIGDYFFWDIVAVSIAGLSLWLFFEQLTLYLDTFIQKHVKEKQG